MSETPRISEERVTEALDRLAELATQLNEDDRLLVGAVLAYAADAVAAREGGDEVSGFNLLGLGDDAQLANVDMQNSLQKRQQTLQALSNISKQLHDTSMSIIRKIGG